MTVPWPLVRRRIARAWGLPPWAVDNAPLDEINLELKLMELDPLEAYGRSQYRR